MALRIIFMGTPEFAVPSLKILTDSSHQVVAVVTTTDKPAGRGLKIQASPIKQFAIQKHIPVLQPTNLKDPLFISQLKSYHADLYVVVAFRMLPEQVWKIPPKGTINLHASLLPQYRGAAPINWAIINGETETGVTTFFIEKDIDTGKIIMQEKVPILPDDSAGMLHDKLMFVGAQLLLKTVDAIDGNTIQPIDQYSLTKNMVLKTAPKIFKENCSIDWNKNCTQIHNLIRGLSPYPAAYSHLINGQNNYVTKIYEASVIDSKHTSTPGSILTDEKTFLHVAAKDGFISIKEIQVEGKKRLPISEFLRGFHDIKNYSFV